MFFRRWVALAAASLAFGGIARADVPPPSALERTIPTQVQQGYSAPVLIVPKRAADSLSTNKRFTLGAVNIDGGTIFSEQQLSRHFEPYLATSVDEAKLAEIAAAITRQYHHKGYILSYATVPAQNIEAGMVRLRVVEGKIDHLDIEGAGPAASALKTIAAPLLTQGPLKRSALERTLGLMRDFPGLKIVDVALIQSDVQAGLYTLRIIVVPSRVRAFAYFDNRGIAGMGHARLFTSASVFSVVEAGDELRADLFGMPGDRARYIYGQIFAAAPLGENGLRLSLSGSQGNQYLRAPEHFDGRSELMTAELSYPFRRSRDLSIIGRASLSDSLTTGTASGTRQLRDHLRVARFGFTFISEGRSQVRGDLVFSQGLDFRGMTKRGDPLASRAGASGKFRKAAASVEMTRPLSSRFTLRATMLAQYADRPLLSAEEFSLGGNRVGRAFEFNTLTGARGAGAGVELGYRLASGDRAAPELFGFADGGFTTTLQTPNLPTVHRSLASVGSGVRFTFQKFGVSLEAGVPLSRSGHHSPRFFVTLFRAL